MCFIRVIRLNAFFATDDRGPTSEASEASHCRCDPERRPAYFAIDHRATA